MNCPHCHKDLKIFEASGSKFSHCPFCGKALPEPEKPAAVHTLEDALNAIVRQLGREVLRQENKLPGFVRDMAPELERRELNLMRPFLELQGAAGFLELRGAPLPQRQTRYQKTVLTLCQDYWLTETAARRICDIFWRVIFEDAAPGGTVKAAAAPAGEIPFTPNLCAEADKLYEQGENFNYGKGCPVDRKISDDCYFKAAELYRKAAQSGDAHAMYRLGECCRLGRGTLKDKEQGYSWFCQSADRNHAPGIYYQGWCVYNGEGTAKDIVQGVKLLHRAMEQGSGDAAQYLGWIYEHGKGVVKDEKKAVAFYRKAVDLGSGYAAYNLGMCYKDGKGVARDLKKAVDCFRKATKMDILNGRIRLMLCYEQGEGVPRDDRTAQLLYREVLEKGSAYDMHSMGVDYHLGIMGLETNHSRAVELLTEAVNRGDISSCCWLGHCYKEGKGVTMDAQQAIALYRRAAEGGDSYGYYNLGRMYADGKDVPKDMKKAAQCYRQAAEKGERMAQVEYGRCCARGNGVPKDLVEAAAWYRKAADDGSSDAQYELGLCYEEGKGVPKSRKDAVEWYRKAASNYSYYAKERLKALGEKV